MAFDPQREDYQRLGLRFARSLDGRDPAEAAKAFAGFGRTFAQDRDALPQTDADRAFHLVSMATAIIDYEMPFYPEDKAAELGRRAKGYLDEAVALDPRCFDAWRMSAAAGYASFEDYYDYLRQGEAEVRAACEEEVARVDADEAPERAALARDIARRPYLRWLACEASKALICGHNKAALKLCGKLLDLDPADAADARFTCALAYAKLEDPQGLDRLVSRRASAGAAGAGEDAWTQLARISLAHKSGEDDVARDLVLRLANTYPLALETLSAQRELPDGVYARLAVTPFSEDELIIAVSEATILTQEGRDAAGKGALGSWLAATAAEISERQAALTDALSGRAGAREAGAPGTAHDGGAPGDAGADGHDRGTATKGGTR